MSDTLLRRWLKRYRMFFLLGLFIIAVQIFLAYKSLGLLQFGADNGHGSKQKILGAKGQRSRNLGNFNSVADDEDINNSNLNAPPRAVRAVNSAALRLDELGFQPDCEIIGKDAISALHRARTIDCKKQIANATCLIQNGKFYARSLPNACPNGNHVAGRPLGCYKDEKEFRLLSGYYTNFKTNNSPKKCIQMCLQSGFPYAGVQHSTECFCGNDEPPGAAKLPDPNCNMKCSGDSKDPCGGYFTINIYETGIAKFRPQTAETVPAANAQPVRIVFLLTLNGRALRQVHRLIKALYSSQHFFYIHIDARQDYLYRELLKLESSFSNIHLARERFSTIWGGASLLTMLLQCMRNLLQSDWRWDFVINLSESDFPVKTTDRLVNFLTANRGRNFVKSHGKETQRFIQKQGLDKTFLECDTHMWRISDRQLPDGIQIDGGSDWIALSRDFVQYVTNPAEDELLEGLVTIFRHTLLPAESFFHTVLRNSKYCGTYVDNNLHVTNWNRRLGCKCQYKHVVDWCGCSPNDFKTDDWQRLLATEHKHLFFARKFESIINQAISLLLEEWLFGPYTDDFVNLHAYWQSIYHADDRSPRSDDAALTIANSLMRLIGNLYGFVPLELREITNFKHNDEYKGFLLRYTAFYDNGTIELETRIRPNQTFQTIRNSNVAKRIRNFEVSSEFDQKEQISRNFAKFLGPNSEPVVVFKFLGAQQIENHSYNLSVLWIDPRGQLQDYNELHIEDSQSDAISFSKANLKHPLTPGIWTVKLIGKTNFYAQTKFLISPLSLDGNRPIRKSRADIVNGGSQNAVPYPHDWQQYLLSDHQDQAAEQSSNSAAINQNANLQQQQPRFDQKLASWIDSLVVKFFLIRETCSVRSVESLNQLPMCTETSWSSLSPDPKSDVFALLKRKR